MGSFFGKGKERIGKKLWDWESFKSTEGFPVSNELLDWVIGQERALSECYLCLEEWVHKLHWMEKEHWFDIWEDPNTEKPSMRKLIPPGPYLLLLGDPGTGKSLIGRALASHLTKLYKKHKVNLRDVLCWPNKTIPSEPKISCRKAGEGKKQVMFEKLKHEKKQRFKRNFIKAMTYFMATVGLIFISAGFYLLWNSYSLWCQNPMTGYGPLQSLYANVFEYLLMKFLEIGSVTFLPAGMMIIFLILIIFLGRFGMYGTTKGISGSEQTEAPKLIVDNSEKVAPFIDATGHKSAQLFGSIAWDPLQCYSEDTRVFTRKGLKTYNQLKEGDKVLSINPKTRNLKWTKIKNIFITKYKGPMIYFIGQRENLLVTPQHRMLAEEGEFLAKDFPLNFHLPYSYSWEKGEKFNKDLMRLFGWYVTEGHPRKDRPYIIITQKNKEKKQEIISLLQKLKLRFYVNGKAITITEQDCYSWFKEFGETALTKKIPRRFLDANRESLEALLETMLKGDGSKERIFYTSSQELRNNFIEIAIKLGYHVTLGEDKRIFRKNKGYYLSISKNARMRIKSRNKRILSYNGYVWCPHLEENHYFLVERKGRLAFSGNTGGLGTPEHQRTTAGDVHKANLGILYIDEIKNLHPEEAVTLLTVLEEGQLPITLRSRFPAGGTSAMAVATEPIPCLCFLVGAGNFDSISQIHPALMDRIYGYGKVVRMNNDMPNTIANRRKYVQFIAQECSRFRLKPFSREACIELTNEGRRRSNKRNGLVTKFRPLIAIIKTAAILAEKEKTKLVERKHVLEAIEVHCKTIQKQILEHQIEERGKLMEIDPRGSKLDTTYGLAVVKDPVSGEQTGSVLRVKATMIKKGKRSSGYFKVSGIAKEGKFIQDSIDKVRSVILRKYNVDIAQDYCTHIDFSQAYGVDGPSAGVTMTILLCALLEGKPIRQDVAVTGEINLSSTDQIGVTAVGGLYEKIKAAERWSFKKVIIPQKNFDHSIDPRDYGIEIVSGKLLDDYLKEILIETGFGKRKAK